MFASDDHIIEVLMCSPAKIQDHRLNYQLLQISHIEIKATGLSSALALICPLVSSCILFFFYNTIS